ncbi:uncharacterized protein I206_106677 [Kwoniella pini CBS 10737]|uniref:Uncharacterized protein n=1 Tax=Kwoniella pini CBS 10737 TaxID=1296096 RepID=A0A1B9HTJ5_9TREE|nr:uncharacterized protein I206_07433 [Kwoniella pini CBS 10737]OCF46580.1 hypothetical protein I206_07433 [Kwoniella pini CBS 10737]
MSNFDLSKLGPELDTSRRLRQGIPIRSQEDSNFDDAIPELSTSIESGISTSIESLSDFDQESDINKDSHKTTTVDSEIIEKPYPLCLLCLNRPPSAVLLPCCHLNLCYICAPLLIHRSKTTKSKSNSNSNSSPSTTTTQWCQGKSYNTILMNATKNHSKSRKLALGGYRIPEENKINGEFTGKNLINYYNQTNNDVFKFEIDEKEKGRIKLNSSSNFDNNNNNDEDNDDDDNAKCLICREGIKGWLRVYTG